MEKKLINHQMEEIKTFVPLLVKKNIILLIKTIFQILEKTEDIIKNTKKYSMKLEMIVIIFVSFVLKKMKIKS